MIIELLIYFKSQARNMEPASKHLSKMLNLKHFKINKVQN